MSNTAIAAVVAAEPTSTGAPTMPVATTRRSLDESSTMLTTFVAVDQKENALSVTPGAPQKRAYGRVSIDTTPVAPTSGGNSTQIHVARFLRAFDRIDGVTLQVEFPPLPHGVWQPNFAERAIVDCELLVRNDVVATERGRDALMLLDASGRHVSDAARYATTSTAVQQRLSRTGFVLKVPLFSRYFSNGHTLAMANVCPFEYKVAVELRRLSDLIDGAVYTDTETFCRVVVDIDYTLLGTAERDKLYDDERMPTRALPVGDLLPNVEPIDDDDDLPRTVVLRRDCDLAPELQISTDMLTSAFVVTITPRGRDFGDDKLWLNKWHPFTTCTLALNGRPHSTFAADEMRHDNWQRSGFACAPQSRRSYCFTLVPNPSAERAIDGINLSRIHRVTMQFATTRAANWPTNVGLPTEYDVDVVAVTTGFEHWLLSTTDAVHVPVSRRPQPAFKVPRNRNPMFAEAFPSLEGFPAAHLVSDNAAPTTTTTTTTTPATATTVLDPHVGRHNAMLAEIPIEHRCLYKTNDKGELVHTYISLLSGGYYKPVFKYEKPAWVDVKNAQHMRDWVEWVTGTAPPAPANPKVTAAAAATSVLPDRMPFYDDFAFGTCRNIALEANVPIDQRCLYQTDMVGRLVFPTADSKRPFFKYVMPAWVDISNAAHLRRWAAEITAAVVGV